MSRINNPRWRAVAVVLLALVAGCASDASSSANPFAVAATSPHFREAAVVVLVRNATVGRGDRERWQSADVVKVIKSPAGMAFPEQIEFAHRQGERDVPEGDVVILLRPYGDGDGKLWTEIDWRPMKPAAGERRALVTRDDFRLAENLNEDICLYVDIGHGIVLPMTIDMTTKGNGSIKLGNLCLCVCDEHDDGQLYEDGVLDAQLVANASTGYNDLVFGGSVIHTDDKADEPLGTEPVSATYRYNPASALFECVSRTGPSIEIR